jgi:hypothetical protein
MRFSMPFRRVPHASPSRRGFFRAPWPPLQASLRARVPSLEPTRIRDFQSMTGWNVAWWFILAGAVLAAVALMMFGHLPEW